MEDRSDPMLTYAMTALAANKQAAAVRAARDVRPARRRTQRHQRDPVPGHRRGWTRAASPTPSWSALVAEIERQAGERADRDGTRLEVTAESVSGEVAFDPALTDRLRAGWPLAGATYR